MTTGMVQGASTELLRFLSRLGHTLLATGDAVVVIEDTLRRIAHAHGARNVNVVALPTVLLVKIDEGATFIDFTSERGLALRFDQIEAAFELAQDAERMAVKPGEALVRLNSILVRPPRFGAAWNIFGLMLVTTGIALMLQPTVGVIRWAALLGLIVGVLKVFARSRGMLNTLLPTIAAFVVSLIAVEAARRGILAGPLRVVIAAVATFIPGGVLAVATMDLAYGDMVSGSSRFLTGLVQLMFLVLGMMVAVSLIGLPPALSAEGAEEFGAWAPWLGVLLFGVGQAFHNSARLKTLPWMLLVLFVAAAGQFLGNAVFGGYMSAFIAATMITPMAYLVQYRFGGPPAMVTFQPALWMLVPGAIGLIGLAELVGDNRLASITDFVTALFTIVAIAIGCLIGSWIYGVL